MMATLTLIFSAYRLCTALSFAANPPIAHTQFGDLVGSNLEAVSQWMGIPYAQAPIGEYRFAEPAPWTTPYKGGKRDASVAGAQVLIHQKPCITHIFHSSHFRVI